MTNHVPTDVGTSIDSESLTRVFSVLANTRRRLAIRCLSRHRSVSLATLADEVAEREANVPLREIDGQTVADVYLSLYHTHVPKLEDVNLVAYDQERDWVTRRDDHQWELVSTLLDSVPTTEGT
jgi:DNA-binding transcriptional ArsR family regulator